MRALRQAPLLALLLVILAGSLTMDAAAAGNRGTLERISLNFRESSIEEAFDVLSRKDRVNIILGKGVTGTVSVNLYDMTVADAIHRVAEAAGYAVEFRKGDYFIVERKDAGLEQPGGLTQLQTFKVQYSDPQQVAEILSKYLSRYGKVTPLNERRMIVIEDTAEFLARARKLLEQLDAEPRQVLIEAKVLEVTLDDAETYGVDWNRVFGTSGGSGANGIVGTHALASGSVTAGPRDAGLFFSLTNQNLQLFLEAKSTRNRIRTLSTPKLLALENQEAKAVIGKSTGYKVTTTINQVTTESIQFLESGVILKVTPSVDQQGRVRLKVHPEVSSTTLIAGIPEKKSTEVTTELLCEDGQSVFIGGLLKNISSRDKVGIPILGDIPGIGRLFSTSTGSVNNTETVVIITPRIVQNAGQTNELAAQLLKEVDHNRSLIEQQERQLRSLSVLDKLDTQDPH
jgi:type II secretory pathway component GspD/PulD (secretin)